MNNFRLMARALSLRAVTAWSSTEAACDELIADAARVGAEVNTVSVANEEAPAGHE